MDELITRHTAIMDQFDPQKRVSLVVDEWGAWYNVEPGTNPGFLYQQNTLRDAILAGLILNIFHKHADRVQIANIAQMVNVLQAIILTENEKMVLTPTYHVFDMYKVHQDATFLPVNVEGGKYNLGKRSMPNVSATASIDKEGAIHVSFVNINPKEEIEISCDLRGTTKSKISYAQLICGKTVGSYNTFDKPEEVKMTELKGVKVEKGTLKLKLPAGSLVTVEIK